MELPNTRAHTYRDTHTHAHTKKKHPKKEEKTRCNDNQQTTVTHLGENKRQHPENFQT